MAKSTIIPGIHDETHREVFLAAARAFKAAKRFRYCRATAKTTGNRCRGFAMRGTDFCTMHAHPDVKRERRQKRLARLKSPEQIERFNRREAARIQREMWRRDRWAPGSTVALGPPGGGVSGRHGCLRLHPRAWLTDVISSDS
jgi:hypothetical protein